MHITFEGDEDLWSEIQQRRLFGVEPENIGSIWGGTFAQDKPLIFELRPRTTTTTLAGILTDHPLDVAIHIIESPTTSEFRQESTYKLIAVKQQMFEGFLLVCKSNIQSLSQMKVNTNYQDPLKESWIQRKPHHNS